MNYFLRVSYGVVILGSLRWYGTLKWTKTFAIVCYCTQKEKMNFEGFAQNGCYGNQLQPLEALYYSSDANSSCSFTKQDLTVK